VATPYGKLDANYLAGHAINSLALESLREHPALTTFHSIRLSSS
jgi:hypothetical protein